MLRLMRALSVLMFTFLFLGQFDLYGQERQDTREEARQHYEQGRAFYSQGRYEEATSEFEKATQLLSPARVEFIEKLEKEQRKALAPTLPQTTPLPKDRLAQQKIGKIEEKETEITEVAIPPESMPGTEGEITEREYYIDFGDVLDISIWELPRPKEKLAEQKTIIEEKEEYYIDFGDVLDISVWQVPDLSRSEVIVRPDGKISFPLIGDIKAEGLTLTQLDNNITDKLNSYVKTPEVSIMIRRFGKSKEEAKVAARNDLSRSEVIVRPDGKISFPLIGDIKAEGLTLAQLDNSVTEKIKAYVEVPEVSVMLRRFAEETNKVVVLGEIFGPGVYKFSGPPSIIEVIASAGGYTKYAIVNSVMVIRGDITGKPEVKRVNLAKIIKKGRLSENILLKPNDIVYVPKSFIGNINSFLEIFQPAVNEYMQTLNARHLHNVIHGKGGI